MKKAYINPVLDIVKIETQQVIAVSGPNVGTTYSGEQTLGRNMDFDDDEE